MIRIVELSKNWIVRIGLTQYIPVPTSDLSWGTQFTGSVRPMLPVSDKLEPHPEGQHKDRAPMLNEITLAIKWIIPTNWIALQQRYAAVIRDWEIQLQVLSRKNKTINSIWASPFILSNLIHLHPSNNSNPLQSVAPDLGKFLFCRQALDKQNAAKCRKSANLHGLEDSITTARKSRDVFRDGWTWVIHSILANQSQNELQAVVPAFDSTWIADSCVEHGCHLDKHFKPQLVCISARVLHLHFQYELNTKSHRRKWSNPAASVIYSDLP